MAATSASSSDRRSAIPPPSPVGGTGDGGGEFGDVDSRGVGGLGQGDLGCGTILHSRLLGAVRAGITVWKHRPARSVLTVLTLRAAMTCRYALTRLTAL